MKNFFDKRIKSFGFAASGIKNAFLQNNFKIQCGLGFASILLGLFLKITPIEWSFILLCIAAVLAAELFNSAIEEMADTIHPNYSAGIKKTKDMAAAAVLVISAASLLVGLLIFLPKF